MLLLGPLATFTTYAIVANLTGTELDTAKACTSLSLIALLAEPLIIMISFIPQLVGAMACFSRIQAFLQSEARRDHRLLLDQPPEGGSPGTMDEDDIELRPMSQDAAVSSQTRTGHALIEVQNASFAWDNWWTIRGTRRQFHNQAPWIHFHHWPCWKWQKHFVKRTSGRNAVITGFRLQRLLSSCIR